jgi:metal-responsive CopG/Arc/MetJ family transcriptional regulator
MRTLVDIPDPQIRRLDERARRHGQSRAAVIREAVDRLLGPEEVLSLEQAFGLWGDHDVDGLAFQREMRAEWDRA